MLQDNGWFYGSAAVGATARSPSDTTCARVFPPAKNGILKHTLDAIPCLSRVSSCSSFSSDEDDWEPRCCAGQPGPKLAQHKLDMSTIRLACYMFAEDAAALGLVYRRTGIWAQCDAFNG